MLTNYVKIAWRNLLRNRLYSVINIFGLGLGLAVGFVLLYWVNNEHTMNAFHKKADRIYQVDAKFNYGEISYTQNTPAPVAAYAREHITDIEKVVRIRSNFFKQPVIADDRIFVETKIGYTENEFFAIFDFPIIKGSSQKPLGEGLTAVLTESVARKYFGNENPIGKMVRFRDTTLQVTAVMKDFPANSSIQYDILFSMELQKLRFRGNGEWKTIDADWGNYDYSTYALLKDGGDTARAAKNIREALLQANHEAKATTFPFRPLKDIYLYNADGSKGRLVMVQIFMLIGIFILLIAAINYINLVTARATQRIKEISMRKIMGAEKMQLFAQFFCETGLLILLSLLSGLVLIQLFLPIYQQVTDTAFHVDLFNWQLWKVLLMLVGGIWVLSGIYPAFLLSGFRPVQALRGLGIFANTGLIRKSLVVLQFVVSISLVLGTVFTHRQMKFMRESDLHLNTEQVVVFETWRMKGNGSQEFTNEVNHLAGVTASTITNASLFDYFNSSQDLDWPGKTKEFKMQIADMQVDKNFMSFFGIKMKEGRGLETVSGNNPLWILNETAIRKMGLKDPIGQTVKYHGNPGTIIGVAEDFHFQSMHYEMMPALIQYSPENGGILYLRVQPQHANSLVAAAEKIWKKFEPALPMEYHFLNDQIAQQYDREIKASRLFDAFAIVTMLISCLGLFGLTTYSAERRIKEIGIRKVLGAGVGRIALMLSTGFIKLVIIATIIAVPVVWYCMNKILQDFAYRTSLSWSVFALTALAAIGLALLTMSFQAIKAGMSNPVKSLRTE